MVALASGDLGAAETAAAHDLDALGAHAHGTADGILHGAAEADALLQLLGDVLGHKLSVGIGGAHLNDGDGDLLADHLGDLLLELGDLLAALADHDAGTAAVDEDANLFAVALNLDGGHAGAVQGLLQILADVVVLDDQVSHLVVTRVPAGIPVLDDAYAEAVRIYFLSHILLPPLMPSQPRRW